MKKQKKATASKTTIVGFFPTKTEDLTNGEAQKGISIRKLLVDNGWEVDSLSTYRWKRHPVRLFFRFWKACRKSANLLVVTSDGGAKTFLRLGRFFGGSKLNIIYFVVGVGLLKQAHLQTEVPTLAELVRTPSKWPEIKPPKSGKAYNYANHVLVETDTLKRLFETVFGLTNIGVLTNFRDIPPRVMEPRERIDSKIRLVYFSRIVLSKGLDDLVAAFKRLPGDLSGKVMVDIYGDGENEWAKGILSGLPRGMSYCGNLSENKIEVLSLYDAMVFPTKNCEGVPGAVVEGLMAGLPIISSRFGTVDDLLVDHENALIYEFGSVEDLTNKIVIFCHDSKLVLKLKKGALFSSRSYSSALAFPILKSLLVN